MPNVLVVLVAKNEVVRVAIHLFYNSHQCCLDAKHTTNVVFHRASAVHFLRNATRGLHVLALPDALSWRFATRSVIKMIRVECSKTPVVQHSPIVEAPPEHLQKDSSRWHGERPYRLWPAQGIQEP